MPAWLNDAVFYEIYPQSFYDSNSDGIGDIPGITQKLDYILSLGCNALWLNPLYDSPFWDAGYDVRDHKKVAARYGTNEDLFELFSEAHKRGMKVILDLVPGHTSIDHPWFIEAAKHEQNEYSGRFIFTPSVWELPEGYRWVSGYAERDGNFMVNFFSTQPALNYGFNSISDPRWQSPPEHSDCEATFEALLDVMRYWLDNGTDGFRVDMADSLVKNDNEKIATSALWRKAREMLDRDYPEAAMVSEWCCPHKAINMSHFHMDFYLEHMHDGYHNLLRKREDGVNLSYVSKDGCYDITSFTDEYVQRYNDTKNNGYISFITCNHDTPRLTRHLSTDEIILAYAIIFTLPGVPFLYYGDEIGMRFVEGLPSKEGGYSRTGTRTPMQWNSGKNLGFSDAPPDMLYLPVDSASDAPTVEAQQNDKQSMLNTVRDLISLRHAHDDLKADGDFEVLHAVPGDPLFVYRRGALRIFVNPSLNEVNFCPTGVKVGNALYQIGRYRWQNDTLTLCPQSFVVF